MSGQSVEAVLLNWPGKSAQGPDGVCHPALYHMIDVATVAEALISREALSRPLGAAFYHLIALHDLGKIGDEFVGMIRDGRPQIHRHWEVTEAYLHRHRDALLERLDTDADVLSELVAAIAGHHGGPPKNLAEPDIAGGGLHLREMMRRAGVDAKRDAEAAMELLGTLWPEASLAGVNLPEARRLSWWLSGLTTVADWIGSNPDWFPPTGPSISVADYLELARERAVAALRAAGLTTGHPSDGNSPLYAFDPRPMQHVAADAPLPGGPMLAVLEDETGSGKTEAALILARRMMAAGKGRGLYFALPTMATADAMLPRLAEVMARLFEGRPSLALAHGRAALSGAFRNLVGRRHDPTTEEGASCAPWLADGRRKALLADVGVGTVDQALLGVLPTRFLSLRLWGLSSKILIVDEAHDYDPYMAAQLEALLYAHARLGGSAILMTATLPLVLRRRFSAAFARGRGEAAFPDAGPAYPALSVNGALVASGGKASPRGPVAVQRLESEAAAVGLAVRAAGQGAAASWVRNAVDDAIGAVQALRAQGVVADLLHARYTLFDRKRIEERIRELYGKDRADRPGRVLVGTQVLEASLDLDFDVMFSDLAPIAALIQRAGRLWRHMDRRPAPGRPAAGPVLHVLSPDPAEVETDRWVHQVLGSGAYVYGQDDQWRTAEVLFRAGEIRAPDGLRDLIEAVHCEAAIPVPAPLARNADAAEGGALAERAQARANLIDFDTGYASAGAVWDDAVTPTRLGEEQRVLVLARRGAGGLLPWAEAETPEEAWMLSEVSASARRLAQYDLPDQGAPEIAAITTGWPDWRRNTVSFCPVAEDGTICEGLTYDPEMGLILG